MARASFLTYQGVGVDLADQGSCNHHPCFLSSDVRSTNTPLYPLDEPKEPSDPPVNSFEVYKRLFMETPPDNKCENIQWYGPVTRPALSGGMPNVKLTVYCGVTTTSSHTPTDNTSAVATIVQHANVYSFGTALSVPCATGDGWLDAYGEMSWWVCLQFRIEHGAGQGDIETWIDWWAWEES
jgi:hypothetical protein